jgi:cation diffusion facilitator CzcD-associated flavoprotein CzcO
VAAEVAEHVYVFQRSPNFTVPAHNGPMDKALWGDIRDHLEREREVLLGTLGGRHQTPGAKIRAVVDSAEIAQKLAPRDHPIGARRPVVDSGYHAAFNRSNVTLVDLRETPLERITAHGIWTQGGDDYDLDLIIFALRFHASPDVWTRRASATSTAPVPPTAGRWDREPTSG